MNRIRPAVVVMLAAIVGYGCNSKVDQLSDKQRAEMAKLAAKRCPCLHDAKWAKRSGIATAYSLRAKDVDCDFSGLKFMMAEWDTSGRPDTTVAMRVDSVVIYAH
jgi:hypothetical protein